MNDGYRTFPLGDSALTVEFGNDISVDLNRRAIALSDHLEAHPFPGFVETVPAYASTTIFYDVRKVCPGALPHGISAFEAVLNIVLAALASLGPEHEPAGRPVVEIPVQFDGNSALDLEVIASHGGISTEEVIEIFTSRTYRVFMVGFLPGFTYMAEVDERIAAPRRDAPRISVPKGSVGIAGPQTGIYSLASPGGWQIIGRTEVEMFTPRSARPTLLKAGDNVRFVTAK